MLSATRQCLSTSCFFAFSVWLPLDIPVLTSRARLGLAVRVVADYRVQNLNLLLYLVQLIMGVLAMEACVSASEYKGAFCRLFNTSESHFDFD